jgi:hypothetical protein
MSYLHSGENDLRKIVQSIRELWQGRSLAVGEVTLRDGHTTTVVEADNCGAGARVFLAPRTLNAAGALATTYIPVASVVQGAFTIVHANAVSTDRTFGYECRG